MKSFLQKNHRLLFYSSWIVLGLIQSRFTELWDDEAYYWVYSRFLNWGYFDHPPMVALLVKAGYAVFQNELGVRLMFMLLNVLTVAVLENLVQRKNHRLFYTIALSLAVLQVGGFLAVPDVPLIFFTALFFLCYKKFLRRSTWLNTLTLAIVAAALLFSKYHGVLIIFFVLLSNLRLLNRYQTYVVGVVALLMFTPHLWWQYQHGWVSFRYHLFESNVNPYKVSHTLDYLVGQVLLAGPMAGIILLPAAFLYRSANSPENAARPGSDMLADRSISRALKFTLVGIYVFFFISSFRGKVEANWTSPAIVPLFILSHNFLAERETPFANWGRKWLFRLLPLTMALVVVARVAMLVDILPVAAIRERYHSWKNWPRVMKKATRGLPIVFESSYQRASKYWFYSGQMSYSLNSYKERINSYNLWPLEDSLLGKPVYILDIHNLDSFQNKMQTAIGTIGYKYDSAFSSFAKVQFVATENVIHSSTNLPFAITITAELSSKYRTYIQAHPEMKIRIVAGVFDKQGWVRDLPVPYSLQELVQQKNTLHFDPRLPKGAYYLIFSVFHIGTINPTHNSKKIKLVVD